MKVPYTFSVIRYMHDVVGGEFANVGVALYAPSKNFVDVRCTKKYGRLSKIFIDVDGEQFRSLMYFLESQIHEYRYRLESEFRFKEAPRDISGLLNSIIPLDDSSLQISPPGGGESADLPAVLEELYQRYVERYVDKPSAASRDDDQVWRVFRKPLEERKVLSRLSPHKIIAKNFEYEFKHSWKNDRWRALEAVSFDLEDPYSITDKANRWLGRAISLEESSDKFKLYFLLGKPHRTKLLMAFQKAENILHKIRLDHAFIQEEDAQDFAEEVRSEIETHI